VQPPIALFALLAITACSAGAPRGAALLAPSRAADAVAPRRNAELPHPTCTTDGIHFSVDDVDLTCGDSLRMCTAMATARVVNCTARAIHLRTIVVVDGDEQQLTVTFDGTPVPPGDAWSHGLLAYHPGSFQARLTTVERAGASAAAKLASFTVTNLRLDEAKAACVACNGAWGPLGMAGNLRCNCRTHDGGRECRDGDQCEGTCLVERTEILQRGHPPICDASGCSARFGTGRLVGRCSEWRYLFGCHARIPSGASRRPPVTLPARAYQTCVD